MAPTDRLQGGASADDIVITGGSRLRGGHVNIPGFKHSLVTVFTAAMAVPGKVVIDNCPDIQETAVLCSLVERLGGSAVYGGERLELDTSSCSRPHLDRVEASSIHGSLYLAPALLARFGRAQLLDGRGGCQIGSNGSRTRPVEHYVRILETFGAQVRETADGVWLEAPGGLHACSVDLLDYCADRVARTGPEYSGASKMAVLAASVATGASTLLNLYPKSDVHDMLGFLAAGGLGVTTLSGTTLGTSVLVEGGLGEVSIPLSYTLTPDLVAIVTWASVSTLLCESPLALRMHGASRALSGMGPEVAALRSLGVDLVQEDERTITCRPIPREAVGLYTSESTGLYSDSLPFLLMLASVGSSDAQARGSTFVDTVWPDRFDYVPELKNLGANIELVGTGRVQVRRGWAPVPSTAHVRASELRGAAVLLIAALRVSGTTRMSGARHLARGYVDFVGTLRRLGAIIREADAGDS